MDETLALLGGEPVRTTPMPSWPSPGDEEVEAVEAVLRSGKINYWTGTKGREFERAYAKATHSRYGIAVANGTVALELALRALGLGAGDEVIVPARSFVATASCVVAVGAVPIVADIDPDSNALTAESCAAVLSDKTRAIIPVHLGGYPADMDPIMDLAGAHDLFVIEDCAQAHGAFYNGRPAGSIGHVGCFSFCQDKIIPTGEGGMLVTSDREVYRRAWEYKDHGKSTEKLMAPEEADGTSYRWLVDSFGSNLRLGELEAAIGLVALEKLPGWHVCRTKNALRLAEGVRSIDGIETPLPPAGSRHAFYRLYGRIDIDRLAGGWDRDRVLKAIQAEGVPVQYGSCAELYREKAFIDAGFSPARPLPNAARAHLDSIAFFVHPTLEAGDIDDTIAAVRKVLSVAIAQ